MLQKIKLDKNFNDDIGKINVNKQYNIYNMQPTRNSSYAFMVRPQLNLSFDNIKNDDDLRDLLEQEDNPYSTGNIIRATLDPRGLATKQIKCPLVDILNPFIPIVTNNFKIISGLPSRTNDLFKSKPNNINLSWVMIDSLLKGGSNFDINLTFRKDPVDLGEQMFQYWLKYVSMNLYGSVISYSDMFVGNNELDYTTRIFIIVMDNYNKHVKYIADTSPGTYIRNDNIGSHFDYDVNKTYNDKMEYTIQMHCMKALYNLNENIYTFNAIMNQFNDFTDHDIIPRPLIRYYDGYKYPYIDPQTKELQWYGLTSEILKYQKDLKI